MVACFFILLAIPPLRHFFNLITFHSLRTCDRVLTHTHTRPELCVLYINCAQPIKPRVTKFQQRDALFPLSTPVSLPVNERQSDQRVCVCVCVCSCVAVPDTPPQIICEKRWEPSDELKSVAPPPRLPSLFFFSMRGLRILASANPRGEQGAVGGGLRGGRGERVGRREKEGQDQQPPGLAAHRSCHSWEGRMGGGGWREGWRGRR